MWDFFLPSLTSYSRWSLCLFLIDGIHPLSVSVPWVIDVWIQSFIYKPLRISYGSLIQNRRINWMQFSESWHFLSCHLCIKELKKQNIHSLVLTSMGLIHLTRNHSKPISPVTIKALKRDVQAYLLKGMWYDGGIWGWIILPTTPKCRCSRVKRRRRRRRCTLPGSLPQNTP